MRRERNPAEVRPKRGRTSSSQCPNLKIRDLRWSWMHKVEGVSFEAIAEHKDRTPRMVSYGIAAAQVASVQPAGWRRPGLTAL